MNGLTDAIGDLIHSLSFMHYFFFAFGLVMGSFLNCVIYRLSKNRSALSGRSCCPDCGHKLSWQDLIPVISFIARKGKCHYCGKPISIQYPLVELAIGLLFVLIFWQNAGLLESDFGFGLARICFLLIVSCFLAIVFVYDLKHFIIPDKILFPLILITFVYYLFADIFLHVEQNVLGATYSAFGASAFFLFIVLASKGRWMGMGDVKLAFFMGLFLGFPGILVALFLAFFSGAIIGMILIGFKKKTFQSEVPFGPFLVFGTFLAFFYCDQLVSWYLSLCS